MSRMEEIPCSGKINGYMINPCRTCFLIFSKCAYNQISRFMMSNESKLCVGARTRASVTLASNGCVLP